MLRHPICDCWSCKTRKSSMWISSFRLRELIGQLVPYLCGGAYDRWLDAMLGKLFFIIYSRD